MRVFQVTNSSHWWARALLRCGCARGPLGKGAKGPFPPQTWPLVVLTRAQVNT